MELDDVKRSGFVVNIEDVQGARVRGENERVLKVLMSPEVGNYEEGTILTSHIESGKHTGEHTHESNEIMYVVEGEGKSVCGGKAEGIREGSVIFAPAGVKHDLINSGNDLLMLFCVYIPSIKPTGKFLEATENMKEKFAEM